MKVIAVAGAGTMGRGIAQISAQSGFDVLLFDANAQGLAAGIKAIEKDLNKLVEKGKISEDEATAILNRIKPVNTANELVCDLFIEAIIEVLPVKQELFKTVESVNSEFTVLATNTSSLSVAEIGASLVNPARFAGLHFFNPATLMKLVEITCSPLTAANTVTALQTYCRKIGKTTVLCADRPGFIVNRVARHFYTESLKAAEEGLGNLEDLDALTEATGFRMGPFKLMDFIGNDINFAVTCSLYEGFFQEPRFRPSLIQQEKVRTRQLGKKTGKGFYDYSNS